ncbi:UvrD-helicase domain-containing protein [Williamsia sp. DF01-3]|uniref:UvrD-helicase domain-containing protein n=1 Tax=Williamsia sp. DF01-3 TaxID=2934157 RepID=UPI001FF4030C|nr:UvrD-helicase domain-containing protein [Williamsia sp. DF01-3]MCK0517660.1 UvrD-helicase domain-containing protein [Williamsia sp. DF01-3]
MTGSESGAIELNPEQAAVAEAPADSRLLVIAGAGQGKTEVVASRVEHLATEEGLSPSTEMLVLSFSRAAVHAVRSRIANREMAETNVRTFDSFASYLLVENDIEPVGDFESRIRQATKLLSDGDDDIYGVEDIQHVILDEVQDLVGDRAEMVLAILENLHEDAGFTALGDPLQAVYDFTLANSRSKTTSTQFITALTDRFNAERVSLGPNYRARGAFPKRVVSLGNVLREDHVVAGAQQRIKTFEDTLPHSGVVDDWGFLREPAGKTAILCKSNAEVLRVSRVLTKHDVRHVVRRQATDFGAARWIAGVLAPLPALTSAEPISSLRQTN